jgi:hypothetical protein
MSRARPPPLEGRAENSPRAFHLHRYSVESRCPSENALALNKTAQKIAVAFDARICEKARHLSR